ncbi:DUF2127 domain-containing protein [Herbiconiux moechotypicola]|uniref:DUF2127 domain-containing protein n=1 Tax=Herbiconiux moechotypicola TaxID=637393 RepID=A0ABP5QFH2_9MICO|nr:DUF2127 domain-containing protein [Herbiconiux moechotypicola]MCS5729698.1 DUF2127 domain-containing protein [Herbiconiux moechotypicola]
MSDTAAPATELPTAADRRFLVVYRIGLALKGIDGAFELLAGLALLWAPDALARLIAPLAVAETGPHPVLDLIAYWVGRAHHELIAGHHAFIITFLLLHGVVKLALVYCLLRRFHWVYPWALAVLGAFAVYQGVVLVMKPTVGMGLLTVIDLAIIGLVWKEWRMVRRTPHPA